MLEGLLKLYSYLSLPQMLGGVPNVANNIMEPCAEIVNELDILQRRTRETAEELRQLEQEQESFALQYHDCAKITGESIYLCFC